VIRLILWWSLRLPGIPILLAKKDVAEAFKWVWIDPHDVPLFGADLPGADFGLPERTITAIYLCLTFGFTGSPGQWMVWAWLMKLYHASFRVDEPEWNDTVTLASFYLMDDQVLVEPDIGRRPHVSNRVATEAMTLLLGPHASNAEKDKEEGAWETQKLIWGLHYDTVEMRLSLPGPKLEKAQYLLELPEFDHGAPPPPMRLVQELRGNQQFWLCVMPELAPYLGATDALLARTDAKGRAQPRGNEVQQRRAWEDFWEAVHGAPASPGLLEVSVGDSLQPRPYRGLDPGGALGSARSCRFGGLGDWRRDVGPDRLCRLDPQDGPRRRGPALLRSSAGLGRVRRWGSPAG
jgi:hypothetical protein